MEILKFVLVCGGVFSVLLLLSRLFEWRFCSTRRKLSSAKFLCTVAISAALATVLMLLEFPIPFLAPGFYKLDLSELPVMICAFYLGPTAGVLTELLKILLNLLLDGTTTAYVGEFANFVIGCSLVIPAAMVYHFHKKKTSAILGLILGSLIMSIFGSLFNAVYLLPAFSRLFGMPLESIIAAGAAINCSIHNITTFVLLAVLPLNLLKGAVVSVLTMLLYKRTERVLPGRLF